MNAMQGVNMHKISQIISQIVSTALMISIFGFTMFMFLNCAEILLEKDIPKISAIKTVNAQYVIEGMSLVDFDKSNALFGTPQDIRIPSIHTKLEMIEGTVTSNGWLTRNNKANYFYTYVGNNSNVEHIIVYTTKNWRTVQSPELLKENENIYIDTQEWRYLFRITSTHTIDLNTPFVAPETTNQRLLLIVQDFDNSIIYIMEAEFLDIQAIM